MALINCPECGKEISDKAENCPNCGFVLIKNECPKIRKTPLHDTIPSPTSGNIYIWMGIAFIVIGLFTLALFIGVVLIAVGVGLIMMGNKERAGKGKKADCPYCGNEITVESYQKSVKCPYCQKISTRKNDYLETID